MGNGLHIFWGTCVSPIKKSRTALIFFLQLRQPGYLFWLNSLLVKSSNSFLDIAFFQINQLFNESTIQLNVDPWLSVSRFLGGWLFLIALSANCKPLLLKIPSARIPLRNPAGIISVYKTVPIASRAYHRRKNRPISNSIHFIKQA
jgi:hypothetical protein